MKVVFLDFDGVLNQGSGPGHPVMVRNLHRILRWTGAVIVVHSSWRYGRTLQELRHILWGWGIPERHVYDVAPVPAEVQVLGDGQILIELADMQAFVEALPEPFQDHESPWHYERPASIQMWLGAHPDVTDFVILDDAKEFAHLADHHVCTRINVGLTEEQARDAIRILGDPVGR